MKEAILAIKSNKKDVKNDVRKIWDIVAALLDKTSGKVYLYITYGSFKKLLEVMEKNWDKLCSVTKEGMKYSAVMESIVELDEKSCGKILVRCMKHSNPKCKRNKEILMDCSELGWVVTSRGEKVRRKYRRIRATELLQNKRKEMKRQK